MRSKLLHTVVGVGIALGASACGGLASPGHEASGAKGASPEGGRGDLARGGSGAGGLGGGAGLISDARGGVGSGPAAGGAGNGFSASSSAIGGVGSTAGDGPAAGAAALGGSAGAPSDATGGAAGGGAGGGLQGFDPFCDATWPTTKGHHSTRPVCVDPTGACDPADQARCTELSAPYWCEDWMEYSPFCIDSAWVCAPGFVLPSDCRCWGSAPEGMACTEGGWMPSGEGGAGGA